MMPSSGPFDPQLMALFQELTGALIQFTPEHFKVIHATIRPGGGDELSYEISCPEFPDEGTTKVNARVHAAAMNLVRYWTRDGAVFPGVQIVLTQQADGTWKNNIKNLEYVEGRRQSAGSGGEDEEAQAPTPPKPWWKFW